MGRIKHWPRYFMCTIITYVCLSALFDYKLTWFYLLHNAFWQYYQYYSIPESKMYLPYYGLLHKSIRIQIDAGEL